MSNTYQLQFHPVWDEKLSSSEKEQYFKSHSTIPFIENEWTTSIMRVNEKENGGIVATVFMNNGFTSALSITACEVVLKTQDGTMIATGNFIPDLHIDAKSSLLWSFVFSKEMVIHRLISNQKLQVEVRYQ